METYNLSGPDAQPTRVTNEKTTKGESVSYLGYHRKGIEFLYPLLTDHDALLLVLIYRGVVPLSHGMLDELLYDSWVKGVGNIEHVVSITTSAFRVRVGKILFHVIKRK